MLYTPIVDESMDWIEQSKKNWEAINQCDKESSVKGELAGRYITEPIADGNAVYQIVRENKKTVRIQVCTGLGDDWVIPYFGEEATVDKSYVIRKISQREALKRLFAKK